MNSESSESHAHQSLRNLLLGSLLDRSQHHHHTRLASLGGLPASCVFPSPLLRMFVYLLACLWCSARQPPMGQRWAWSDAHREVLGLQEHLKPKGPGSDRIVIHADPTLRRSQKQ